jgi:hypothetical protein
MLVDHPDNRECLVYDTKYFTYARLGVRNGEVHPHKTSSKAAPRATDVELPHKSNYHNTQPSNSRHARSTDSRHTRSNDSNLTRSTTHTVTSKLLSLHAMPVEDDPLNNLFDSDAGSDTHPQQKSVDGSTTEYDTDEPIFDAVQPINEEMYKREVHSYI